MNYTSPFGGLDPIGSTLFNKTDMPAAYHSWLGAQGFNPFDNAKQYQYGQGLYDYFQNDYASRSAREGGLNWTDYLDQMGNKLGSMWSGLDPHQRGIDEGQSRGRKLQYGTGPFGQAPAAQGFTLGQ